MTLHRYRSHNCNELTQAQVGQEVRLSGWVHKKRDHGNLLFVDLRDHFGLTQLVAEKDSASFAELETLKDKGLGPRDLGLPAARACLAKGDPARAVAWLAAIPARYRPAELQDDPAFAALREREDFRALFERR